MSYRPKIKANASGGLTDLPLDAETIKGIDIVDSSTNKIKTSVLPAIAISETFTAASEAAMLALTAQVGDVCVRTDDVAKTYILVNTPASTLANWMPLNHPADAVSSVNGKTGPVTLDAGDVGAYPNTNPNGYISGITSSMVTSALGYTPGTYSKPSGGIPASDLAESYYKASNPSGYISGITSSMVTSALGYTPGTYSKPSGGIPASDLAESYYKASNPSGYISGITKSMVTSALGYTPGTSNFTGYTSSNKLSTNYIQNDAGWSSFSGYTSSNKLHTDYINNAAGWSSFSGYTSSNKLHTDYINNAAGWISGITSSMVTSALGYTPYNSSNPSGYISGITKTMVTDALGYTPGTSNFTGYTTNNKLQAVYISGLKNVATTGKYSDLTDKPSLGDQVTYSYNSTTHVLTITTL